MNKNEVECIKRKYNLDLNNESERKRIKTVIEHIEGDQVLTSKEQREQHLQQIREDIVDKNKVFSFINKDNLFAPEDEQVNHCDVYFTTLVEGKSVAEFKKHINAIPKWFNLVKQSIRKIIDIKLSIYFKRQKFDHDGYVVDLRNISEDKSMLLIKDDLVYLKNGEFENQVAIEDLNRFYMYI